MNNLRYELAVKSLLNAGEYEKAAEVAEKYHDSKLWVADDGNCEASYFVENREDAAQAYVDDGDWNLEEQNKTIWIQVYTWPGYQIGSTIVVDRSEAKSSLIAIDPPEPQCTTGHQWESPHHLVGGIESNPGVFGKAGGVIIKEVCVNCNSVKVVDTWDQCRHTGVQGLTSIFFRESIDDQHQFLD